MSISITYWKQFNKEQKDNSPVESSFDYLRTSSLKNQEGWGY